MSRLKTLLSTLVLLLSAVIFIPPVAHAETVSLQPTRDTYVDSGAPTSSYGSIGLGVVSQLTSPSSSRIVLLHFDLSSIPTGSTVTSAVLTMRMGGCINSEASAGNINSALYSTNGSAPWTESSTYQQLSTNGSSLDTFAAQVVGCNPGGYIDFDMMGLIPYIVEGLAPNDGIVLKAVNGGDYWTRVFYMREAVSASRPTLNISYEIPYEVVETPDGGPTAESEAADSESVDTNSIKADESGEPLAPDLSIIPPASLTVSQPNDVTDSINLTWAASATPDIQQYRVYRKVAGEAVYSKLAEVPASNKTYKDLKVKPGVQHSYLVRAVRSEKESPNSPVATLVANSAKQQTEQATAGGDTTQGYMWALLCVLSALLVCFVGAYFVLHRKHHKLKAVHAQHLAKTPQPKQ